MEWAQRRTHDYLVREGVKNSYPAASLLLVLLEMPPVLIFEMWSGQAERGMGNCRRDGTMANGSCATTVVCNGVKRDGPLKYSSSGYKGYGCNSRKMRPSFCSIR